MALTLCPVFFNETKVKNEVSRFRFEDSHSENPIVAVEKWLSYLPQDRRFRYQLVLA
jgi:hypothetical protein